MRLFSWFSLGGVSDVEVRAEIWRLGSRHMGQPLEGALDELKATGLPPNRVLLLRACVKKLQRQTVRSPDAHQDGI